MSATAARIADLRRARRRDGFLRGSLLAFAALAVYSWTAGDFALADLFSERRLDNLRSFLAEEVVPRPLRDDDPSTTMGAWLKTMWTDAPGDRIAAGRGAAATLGISVLAIVLSWLAMLIFAPFGARSLMICDPYVPNTRHSRWCHAGWTLIAGITRLGAVLLRAIPEYVWAFLLLAMLGPNAWPPVLALAIHNSGILTRLGADTIENLPPGPLRALRSLGADRRQLAAVAVFPAALPRFLLYFFYRFETCVREATVLGMLGVVSLGYYVMEARSAFRYDELMFLVLVGAALVLAADVVSGLVRRRVRGA
jgi:phosphonate transport system permease protein